MSNASKHPGKRFFDTLLNTGSAPESSLPARYRGEIETLSMAGAIRRKRSGAGARYEVVDHDLVRDFVRHWFPADNVTAETGKARALIDGHDTHSIENEVLLLSMYATDGVVWRQGNLEFPAGLLSQQFGACAICIDPNSDTWSSNRPLALAENMDAILHADKYLEKIGFEGALIFYSGRIQNLLLSWIAESWRGPDPILHLPDYDANGLESHARLLDQIGCRARLFVPENIDEMMRIYGKERLYDNRKLDNVLDRLDDDGRHVYRIMKRYRKGLEQESLVLNT